MEIKELETKLNELTDKFNSLLERLNKSNIKTVVDFSDLEINDLDDENFNFDENTTTDNQDSEEDFEIMPK